MKPNSRGKVIFSAPMPDGSIRRYHGEAGSLLYLIRLWNLERFGKLRISTRGCAHA